MQLPGIISGSDVLTDCQEVQGISVKQRGSQSQFGMGEVEGHKVALAKPHTYMNLSGKAVTLLGQRFKVLPGRYLGYS